MTRLIGDAYIVIYPQTDGFRAKTEADVNKALKSMRPSVNVGAQLNPEQVAAMKAELDGALSGDHVITLDKRGALQDLDDIADRTDAVAEALGSLRARVNDTDAEAKLARLGVQAAALAKAIEKAPDDAAWAPFEARLLSIEAAFDKINAAKININDAAALASLGGLAQQAGNLRVELQEFRANIDDTAAEAKLAALEAQATKLSRALTFAPGDADLAPFEAQLLAITAAYDKLRASATEVDGELETQSGLWARLGLSGVGALTSLREVLNAATSAEAGITLFSGALGMMYTAARGGDAVLPSLANHLVNTATAAHLSIEAVVEFTAVWAPALIAMTAFGLAATPTVIEIGKQLQNMNTAAEGTGRAFQSLATSSASVVDAVRPTVLEAFGIALFAVQNHASDLANVMKTLGQGIDQFAAKAAIAFDSTTGSKFFAQGSADALALTQSFQELGDIMATVFKLVPGYAEILLGFGNTLLSIASSALKVVEPALQIGVAMHGALLYGGLAGTAIAAAFSKILAVTAAATEAVAGWAAANLAADSVVVEGLGKVLLGMDALGAAPVIAGIGLVTGAIIAIAIYLKAASNAATEFNATIQKSLSNTAVTALPQALANDLAQANAKVTASQLALAAAEATATSQISASNSKTGDFTQAQRQAGAAMDTARASAQTLAAGQQQLSQQSQNLNMNLGAIAATFGTTIPGALALANGAQVTSNQLMAQGGANWAVISTEIAGYVAQLKVMVPGTGALNQALNALNVTQSQQVTNAQKLASAYQAWLGIVTGGDSAFTSFEQGLTTLSDTLTGKMNPAMGGATTTTQRATQSVTQLGGVSTTTRDSLTKLASGGQDVTTSLSKTAQSGKDVTNTLTTTTSSSNAAATAADTLSVKVGNLTEKFTTAGASMNGTSTAALAARQAFDQQVTSAGQLYGNLQTLSVVSGSTATSQNELAAAGRDLVAQLLPLAAGSKEATAEVFALAQIAGFQGVDSFTALAQWAGNVNNAEKDLDQQQIALTESSANLTQAAKNLSDAMANEVAQGEAQAIAGANSLNSIQGQLATAVENANGKFTEAATTLAGQYYEALIQSGEGASQAEQDVDAFLTKLGATPAAVAVVNAALASLPKTVTVTVNADTAAATAAVQSFNAMVQSLQNKTVVINEETITSTAIAQTVINGIGQEAGGIVGREAGGLAGAAQGMIVPGTSPNGHDNRLIMVKSGELVIPSQHAPKFADMARKASIPGFTRHVAGPVLSTRGGAPYSYAQPGPAGGATATAGPSPAMMTSGQGQVIIGLLSTLAQQGQQQPQNLARAISGANAQGIRRGYFATAG